MNPEEQNQDTEQSRFQTNTVSQTEVSQQPSSDIGSQSADTYDGSAASPTPAKVKPLVWIIIIILLIFSLISVAVVFYLNSQQKSQLPVSPPPATVTPAPTTRQLSPTPDLTVPTISDDTSMETIEQELGSLNLASPEEEIQQLESESQQL